MPLYDLSGASVQRGNLLVYNKDRTLKGSLSRVNGQEELYDKLEMEVSQTGSKEQTAFFLII